MKRNLTKNVIYALMLLLSLCACTKDDPITEDPTEEEIPTNPEEDEPATVYISGYSNEITHMGEVIWKNGTPLQIYDPSLLPTSGYVRYGGIVYDLDIVGEEVYTVWRLNHKALSAYYNTAHIYLWKNDKNTAIKENDPNIHPRAVDIHGQDTYFAGYYIDQYEYPGIWKNGNREKQPGGIGQVHDLLVTNTDVLAVGQLSFIQSTAAAFWKNGILTKLAEGPEFSAKAIAQSGNDTYIVGEGKINSVSDPRSALLWKNGTRQILENPTGQVGASAASIAIAANKIYVTGYAYSNHTESMRATVWIDGKATLLSKQESTARSVAVKGKIVYICGYEKTGDRYRAVMWKLNSTVTANNVTTVYLSNGSQDAEAYCIKVQ